MVFNLPRILIPLEAALGETRVAATPETVKKLISIGFKVSIQQGAGALAGPWRPTRRGGRGSGVS